MVPPELKKKKKTLKDVGLVLTLWVLRESIAIS